MKRWFPATTFVKYHLPQTAASYSSEVDVESAFSSIRNATQEVEDEHMQSDKEGSGSKSEQMILKVIITYNVILTVSWPMIFFLLHRCDKM